MAAPVRWLGPACGAGDGVWLRAALGRCAIPAQEPPAAAYIEACLRIALGRCVIPAQEPPSAGLRRSVSAGSFGALRPRTPRVTFHRGKVTKARRGPSPKGQEAPGPLSAQKTRQTGPAGGCRGTAMWGKIFVGGYLRLRRIPCTTACISPSSAAARLYFSFRKKTCGVELHPFAARSQHL